MSATIIADEGNAITVRISGKLTHAELKAAQQEAAALIRQRGNVNMLVIAEHFAGWEKVGDWGDLSFQYENDPFIKRIAIVADPQWEGVALIFAGSGVRQPSVKFFATEALPQARQWLAQAD